ncbi:hypothetical protein DFJ77DRAFT_199322 [Powellomyces hirtus]|nr:hypothetical protein DFJ77DRAFT_199322 [Powellomyces hirtus]
MVLPLLRSVCRGHEGVGILALYFADSCQCLLVKRQNGVMLGNKNGKLDAGVLTCRAPAQMAEMLSCCVPHHSLFPSSASGLAGLEMALATRPSFPHVFHKSFRWHLSMFRQIFRAAKRFKQSGSSAAGLSLPFSLVNDENGSPDIAKTCGYGHENVEPHICKKVLANMLDETSVKDVDSRVLEETLLHSRRAFEGPRQRCTKF